MRCGKRSRRRRGLTLLELVVALFLFGMMIAATASLLVAGQRQQTLGQDFSHVQSELRTGLRRATRTLRHGYAVVASSSSGAFSSPVSNASQVIVRVPEPTGAGALQVEVRLHVSGGVLYAQRADQAAPGTALLSGVQSLRFEYFQTSGGTRSPVDASPADTTDIRITVTAAKGVAATSATTTVSLRNALVSS